MKHSLERLAASILFFGLVLPTFPQDTSPEPQAEPSPLIEVPQDIGAALEIEPDELKQASSELSVVELEALLAGWFQLLEQQQDAFEQADAQADTPEERDTVAGLGSDRDAIIARVEALIGVLAGAGGDVQAERQRIDGIRAGQEEKLLSTSTIPEDQSEAVNLNLNVLRAYLRPLTKEQVEEQLQLWRALLQRKCLEVRNVEVAALGSKEAAEIDKFNERAFELREERARLIARVSAVIKALKKKGGEVKGHQAYVDSLVATPPITGVRAAWTTARAWLTSSEGGLALLRKLGMALLIVFAASLVARFLGSLTSRAVNKLKRASSLLRQFLVASVRKSTLFLGVLIALGQLGVNMGPLLAAIGAAGLVIGFALQGTLSNFASGLLIMIYRPFDVGHAVAVAGKSGKVHGMSLLTTTIKTFDNQTVHIPNNMVWGDVITNITADKTRRVDMVFGIGYEDEPRAAQRVLMDILKSHDKVLPNPEPVVKVHELGDSSVNFVVRPWVKTEDYWDVYWDVTLAVKERFDAEGLSIPFPQRDVHLISANGELQPAQPKAVEKQERPSPEKV